MEGGREGGRGARATEIKRTWSGLRKAAAAAAAAAAAVAAVAAALGKVPTERGKEEGPPCLWM